MRIEKTILSNLVYNETFGRKTIPFLNKDYFNDRTEAILFELIDAYAAKYNSFPSKEALNIEFANSDKLDEDTFNAGKIYIEELSRDTTTDPQWLLDQTEKFCQDKSIYNAIIKAVKILEEKDSDLGKGAIPQLLSDALAVSFDSNLGHDYFENAHLQYDFYHTKAKRIPFALKYFNLITKGGLVGKSLNVLLASTGVGKSLIMCHMAADNLMMGYNVLYLTMEMSEEKIRERIDANLIGVNINDLDTLSKESYIGKVGKLARKTAGKLIIKEYPTGGANAAHFRHFINELKIKKNFKPDIIYVDYINICSSARMKYGNSVNSYLYIKSIAEELRGLGIENDCPVVTATQTNRAGYNNSDIDLENASESTGIAATADLFLGIMTSEQLAELNQYLVKQLKNRYNDINYYKRFIIGVDKARMKLYDAEESAQDIMDGPMTHSKQDEDRPVMDSTTFGEEDYERSKPKSKFTSKFADFK